MIFFFFGTFCVCDTRGPFISCSLEIKVVNSINVHHNKKLLTKRFKVDALCKDFTAPSLQEVFP